MGDSPFTRYALVLDLWPSNTKFPPLRPTYCERNRQWEGKRNESQRSRRFVSPQCTMRVRDCVIRLLSSEPSAQARVTPCHAVRRISPSLFVLQSQIEMVRCLSRGRRQLADPNLIFRMTQTPGRYLGRSSQQVTSSTLSALGVNLAPLSNSTPHGLVATALQSHPSRSKEDLRSGCG